jgi:hypothetical protein
MTKAVTACSKFERHNLYILNVEASVYGERSCGYCDSGL